MDLERCCSACGESFIKNGLSSIIPVICLKCETASYDPSQSIFTEEAIDCIERDWDILERYYVRLNTRN